MKKTASRLVESAKNPAVKHGERGAARLKKNPTWPNKKHPDMFGPDSSIAVREEELDEYEAEASAIQEAMEEEVDELIESFVDKMDKAIEEEQRHLISHDAEDIIADLMENSFEPWLQENTSDVLDKARQVDRIASQIRELEEAGVEESALEEFFLRTDLYVGRLHPHSYYREGIFAVSEEDYQREWEFRDIRNWMEEVKKLEEWLKKCPVDFSNYTVDRINKRVSNFSISLHGDYWTVNYSLTFSFQVDFDVESVIEAMLSEWDDLTTTPKEEVVTDEEKEAREAKKIFYTFPPQMGGFVVKNLEVEDLPRESKELGICVGKSQYGYDKALRAGKIDIWSVQTPAGRSKFTIEVKKKPDDAGYDSVAQVKGKANRLPGFTPGDSTSGVKDTEVKMLEKFFTDIGLDPWEVSDLRPGLEAVYGPKKNPSGKVPTPKRTFDMPYKEMR